MIARLFVVVVLFFLLVGSFVGFYTMGFAGPPPPMGAFGAPPPMVAIGAQLLLLGLLVAFLGSVLLLIFGGRGRGAGRGLGMRPGEGEGEEVRLMQELNRGLTRMEERVEALETLLLERERKGVGQ